MKRFLESLIKKTPLYYPVRDWLHHWRWLQHRQVVIWERRGRPAPAPHIIKQNTLRAYAVQCHLRTLVETGTYHGDMVEAMRYVFGKIYSIELGQKFFERAREKFKSDKHIELIHGDSGKELGKVIKKLGNEPALFWLDGHYLAGAAKGEKDTPLYDELEHIFNAPNVGHVIIIDDARCFGTDPAYPTIEELEALVLSKRKDVQIAVQDDMIRVTPTKDAHSPVQRG